VINYGNMSFTPSFIMRSYALTPAETGLKFGLLAAGLGIVGPMISGPLSDWVSARWPGGGRVWVTTVALGVSPLIAPWVYAAPTAGDFYLRFTVFSLALTMWLPPLYAVMFDQVLPRMRGITASLYIVVSTITGLGMGPYIVGMVSDATGNLGHAILTVNWVAIPIVAMLVVLSLRVRRDHAGLTDRARSAGEPI
jgi:MFS family permease